MYFGLWLWYDIHDVLKVNVRLMSHRAPYCNYYLGHHDVLKLLVLEKVTMVSYDSDLPLAVIEKNRESAELRQAIHAFRAWLERAGLT